MFSDKTLCAFRFYDACAESITQFHERLLLVFVFRERSREWLMKIYPILKTKQKRHTVVDIAIVRTRIIKYSAKCQALL